MGLANNNKRKRRPAAKRLAHHRRRHHQKREAESEAQEFGEYNIGDYDHHDVSTIPAEHRSTPVERAGKRNPV